MKPAAPTSPSHYRHDRVYRSAERLLASTQRPPRGRKWRGILFGICLGGVLVAWLMRPHPRNEAAIVSAPPAEGSSQSAGTRFRWLNLLPFTLPEKVVSRPSAPTIKTEQNPTPTAAEATASMSLHPTEVPNSSSSLATVQTQARSASVTSWLVVARSSSGLILRGELHTVTAVFANVEFRLSLVPGALGGTVEGTVYLTGATRSEEHLPVSGSWLNRTIVLQEKAGAAPPGRKSTEYKFVIELPEAEDSSEVTGLWSNGAQGQGRLSLHWIPRS